jgi:hypothetical protein
MKPDERLANLLASRATEGLSEEESRELDRLLDELAVDGEELELAAAALDLAQQERDALEAMPEDLKQQILAEASRHLPSAGGAAGSSAGGAAGSSAAGAKGSSAGSDAGSSAAAPGTVAPFDAGRIGQQRRDGAARQAREQAGPFSTRYLGWYAAAAMLILAIWSPWSQGPPPAGSQPTPAEQRAALIDEAPDLIQAVWNPPEAVAFAGVTGDVVWSNAEQRGFMRLRGMPANRKALEQYQLWIVDPSRDARPIDGGVFDVETSNGEVVVPIDAKLEVSNPQAFAITLEQAGGVVVSDGPLLVVAPVEV